MSVTRRDFLTSSAAALAAATLGRPLLASAWQGQGPPPTPTFTPIRRNVGYFTMRGGTIGYLVNQRMAYVSISRGQYDARIYTDDKVKLARALDRDVSHRSALEHKSARPSSGRSVSHESREMSARQTMEISR